MPPKLRQALHWAGSGLAFIGIIFVGLRLHSYLDGHDLSRITPRMWSATFLLSLLYGGANVLLALAWWQLTRHFGALTTSLGSIKIYGISQLAKYVPGNIFHLAGRQTIGMAAGIPAKILVKSMIWELGSIAIAGSLSGWLILPLLFPSFPEVASIFLLLASAVLIVGLLAKIIGFKPMASMLYQFLFLIISGFIFVLLLDLIKSGEGVHGGLWLTIGSAYIAAWLVGLVTPGAPAGVGVREMILLLLLKNHVFEIDLLMAIVLGRLVTIAGDLFFFATATLIPAKLYPVIKNA